MDNEKGSMIHLNPVYPASCGAEGLTHTNHKDINCPACLERMREAERPTMQYNFPRHKAVVTNGVYDQMIKVREEVREMFDAFVEEPDFEVFMGEVFDSYHALETLIRIAEEQRGISPHRVRQATEKKNADRQYYL